MKKNLKVKLIALVAVVAVSVAALSGCFLKNIYTGDQLKQKNYQFVLDTIEQHYYKDVDLTKVINYGVLGTLDKYSYYYNAEEYAERISSLAGSREALGIVVNNRADGAYIVSVAGNSPAERCGMKAGGLIVGAKAVDSEEYLPITDKEGEKLVNRFSVFGKDVKFDIKVDYGGSVSEYNVAKEEFNEGYVWYADSSAYYTSLPDSGNWTLSRLDDGLSLGDGIAYIKLSAFNGDADDQFAIAMDKYKTDGKTSLIVDLRENGGGLLDILCNICNYFVSESGADKAPVLYAKFKGGNTSTYYATSPKTSNYSFEHIVILANDGSASASEAFIGAMLDYNTNVNVIVTEKMTADGATVAKTYGKGIMQSTYLSPYDNSALKLTTAEIFWPKTNISIHDVGVTTATDERVSAVAETTSGDAELTAAIALCA